MKLKFSDKTRPSKVKPKIQRREKLVNRLDQQISYVRQMVEGKRPRGSWAWLDEAGRYFVPIKYGKQVLELKKGMNTIECENLDEVEHALCEVRAMTLAGDLDSQLEIASSEIRSKFEKN